MGPGADEKQHTLVSYFFVSFEQMSLLMYEQNQCVKKSIKVSSTSIKQTTATYLKRSQMSTHEDMDHITAVSGLIQLFSFTVSSYQIKVHF